MLGLLLLAIAGSFAAERILPYREDWTPHTTTTGATPPTPW